MVAANSDLPCGIVAGRHEVEIIRLGRRHGRAQRFRSRVGHRARRKPRVNIRVIGRVPLQVGFVERPPPLVLQLEPVDHRRIGHQRHVFLQPVFEHACHHGPLPFDRGLSFHQRRQRDRAVHVHAQAQQRRLGAKPLHHGRRNLRKRCFRSETVSIGEKITLQAPGGRIEVGNQRDLLNRHVKKRLARAEALLLQAIGDFENRRTFGHRHQDRVDVAPPDAVVDLDRRRGVVESIGARLQCAVFPEARQVKRKLAADDAGLGQLAPDPDRR